MNRRLTQDLINDYDVATGLRARNTKPSFGRVFLARTFGVALLALLAVILIKCAHAAR